MQRLFLKLLWGNVASICNCLCLNSTFSFLWKQTKTEKEYSTPCAIKLSFYELWYYSLFHNHVAFEIKGLECYPVFTIIRTWWGLDRPVFWKTFGSFVLLATVFKIHRLAENRFYRDYFFRQKVVQMKKRSQQCL